MPVFTFGELEEGILNNPNLNFQQEVSRPEPEQNKAPEVFMKRFKSVYNKDGTWTIYDVDIFCELKRTFQNEGSPKTYHFTKEWLATAVQKALSRYQDGYLPTLHIGHNNDDEKEAEVVGFFLPKAVKPKIYRGQQVWAIFSDWVIPDSVYQKIKNLKFPYRSVEINDYDSGEISSCALLQSKPPWVKSSPLVVEEATPEEVGPSAFVQEWKATGVMMFSEEETALDFEEVENVAFPTSWEKLDKSKLNFQVPEPVVRLTVESTSPVVAKKLLARIESALDVSRSLGIPRSEMPQVPQAMMSHFVKSLKEQGVPIRGRFIPANELKATQKELGAKKILEMMNSKVPVNQMISVVSSDGFLLDGHHRWIADLLKDPTTPQKCVEVGLPIDELFNRVRSFKTIPVTKEMQFGGKGSGAKPGRVDSAKGGRPPATKDKAPRTRRTVEQLLKDAQSGEGKALRSKAVRRVFNEIQTRAGTPEQLSQPAKQQVQQMVQLAVLPDATPEERSWIRKLFSTIIGGSLHLGKSFLVNSLRYAWKTLTFVLNPISYAKIYKLGLNVLGHEIPIGEALKHPIESMEKAWSPDDVSISGAMHVKDHRAMDNPVLSKEEIQRQIAIAKAKDKLDEGGVSVQHRRGKDVILDKKEREKDAYLINAWPFNKMGIFKTGYKVGEDPSFKKMVRRSAGRDQDERHIPELSRRGNVFSESMLTSMVRDHLKFQSVRSNKALIPGSHPKEVYFGETLLELCNIYKSPKDTPAAALLVKELKAVCANRQELIKAIKTAHPSERMRLLEELKNSETRVHELSDKLSETRRIRNLILKIHKELPKMKEKLLEWEHDQAYAKAMMARMTNPQDRKHYANDEKSLQRKKAVTLARIARFERTLELLSSEDPEKVKLGLNERIGVYSNPIPKFPLNFQKYDNLTHEKAILSWFGNPDLDRKEQELTEVLKEFDVLDRAIKSVDPKDHEKIKTLYNKMILILKDVDRLYAEEEAIEKAYARINSKSKWYVPDVESKNKLRQLFTKAFWGMNVSQKLFNRFKYFVRHKVKDWFVNSNLDEFIIGPSWHRTLKLWEHGLANRFKIALGKVKDPSIIVKPKKVKFDEKGRGRKHAIMVIQELTNDVEASLTKSRSDLEDRLLTISHLINNAKLKTTKDGKVEGAERLNMKALKREYQRVLNNMQEANFLLETYKKTVIRAADEGYKDLERDIEILSKHIADAKLKLKTLEEDSPEYNQVYAQMLEWTEEVFKLRESKKGLWRQVSTFFKQVGSFGKFFTKAALKEIVAAALGPALRVYLILQWLPIKLFGIGLFDWVSSRNLWAKFFSFLGFSEYAGKCEVLHFSQFNSVVALKFQTAPELRIIRDLREAHRNWHKSGEAPKDKARFEVEESQTEGSKRESPKRRKGLTILKPLKLGIAEYRQMEREIKQAEAIYRGGKAYSPEEKKEAYARMMELHEKAPRLKAKLQNIVWDMVDAGDTIQSLQSRIGEGFDINKMLFQEKKSQKFGGPGSGCAPDSDTPSCQQANSNEDEPRMPYPGEESKSESPPDRKAELLARYNKMQSDRLPPPIEEEEIDDEEMDEEDLGDDDFPEPPFPKNGKPKTPPKTLTPAEEAQKNKIISDVKTLAVEQTQAKKDFADFKRDFVEKHELDVDSDNEEEIALAISNKLEQDEDFKAHVKAIGELDSAMKSAKSQLKELGADATEVSKIMARSKVDLESEDTGPSIWATLLNEILASMDMSFRFSENSSQARILMFDEMSSLATAIDNYTDARQNVEEMQHSPMDQDLYHASLSLLKKVEQEILQKVNSMKKRGLKSSMVRSALKQLVKNPKAVSLFFADDLATLRTELAHAHSRNDKEGVEHAEEKLYKEEARVGQFVSIVEKYNDTVKRVLRVLRMAQISPGMTATRVANPAFEQFEKVKALMARYGLKPTLYEGIEIEPNVRLYKIRGVAPLNNSPKAVIMAKKVLKGLKEMFFEEDCSPKQKFAYESEAMLREKAKYDPEAKQRLENSIRRKGGLTPEQKKYWEKRLQDGIENLKDADEHGGDSDSRRWMESIVEAGRKLGLSDSKIKSYFTYDNGFKFYHPSRGAAGHRATTRGRKTNRRVRNRFEEDPDDNDLDIKRRYSNLLKRRNPEGIRDFALPEEEDLNFGGPGSGCPPDSKNPNCQNVSKKSENTDAIRDDMGITLRGDYKPPAPKPSGKEAYKPLKKHDLASGEALHEGSGDMTVMDLPAATDLMTDKSKLDSGELTPNKRLAILKEADRIRGEKLESELGEVIRPIDENDLSDENVERAMDILEATQKGLDPKSRDYAREKERADRVKPLLDRPLSVGNIFNRALQKGMDQKTFTRKTIAMASSFYGDLAKKAVKPLAKVGTDIMESTIRSIVGGVRGALTLNPMNIMRYGVLSETYTGGLGTYAIRGKNSNSNWEYMLAAGKDPDFTRRVMQKVRRTFGLRPGLDFQDAKLTVKEELEKIIQNLKRLEAMSKDAQTEASIKALRKRWAKLLLYTIKRSATEALEEKISNDWEKHVEKKEAPQKMQESEAPSQLTDKELFIIVNRAKKEIALTLAVATSARPFKAQSRPGVSLSIFHKDEKSPTGKQVRVGFITVSPEGQIKVETKDGSLNSGKIKQILMKHLKGFEKGKGSVQMQESLDFGWKDKAKIGLLAGAVGLAGLGVGTPQGREMIRRGYDRSNQIADKVRGIPKTPLFDRSAKGMHWNVKDAAKASRGSGWHKDRKVLELYDRAKAQGISWNDLMEEMNAVIEWADAGGYHGVPDDWHPEVKVERIKHSELNNSQSLHFGIINAIHSLVSPSHRIKQEIIALKKVMAEKDANLKVYNKAVSNWKQISQSFDVMREKLLQMRKTGNYGKFLDEYITKNTIDEKIAHAGQKLREARNHWQNYAEKQEILEAELFKMDDKLEYLQRQYTWRTKVGKQLEKKYAILDAQEREAEANYRKFLKEEAQYESDLSGDEKGLGPLRHRGPEDLKSQAMILPKDMRTRGSQQRLNVVRIGKEKMEEELERIIQAKRVLENQIDQLSNFSEAKMQKLFFQAGSFKPFKYSPNKGKNFQENLKLTQQFATPKTPTRNLNWPKIDKVIFSTMANKLEPMGFIVKPFRGGKNSHGVVFQKKGSEQPRDGWFIYKDNGVIKSVGEVWNYSIDGTYLTADEVHTLERFFNNEGERLVQFITDKRKQLGFSAQFGGKGSGCRPGSKNPNCQGVGQGKKTQSSKPGTRGAVKELVESDMYKDLFAPKEGDLEVEPLEVKPKSKSKAKSSQVGQANRNTPEAKSARSEAYKAKKMAKQIDSLNSMGNDYVYRLRKYGDGTGPLADEIHHTMSKAGIKKPLEGGARAWNVKIAQDYLDYVKDNGFNRQSWDTYENNVAHAINKLKEEAGTDDWKSFIPEHLHKIDSYTHKPKESH